MESLKNKIKNLPLQRYFMLSVFVTFFAVVILSGLTIWGCSAFREYLLPDSNMVYLTVEQTFEDGSTTTITVFLEYGEQMQELPILIKQEAVDESEGKGGGEENEVVNAKYAIQKIENSFSALTPKRKLAYRGCGVVMIAVPLVLSILGILVCGFYFYRRKLSEPLQLLSQATEQIAGQNLDFTLEYSCQDEMGKLCGSFEQMRLALEENHKAMWELLEQRKLMQASIAHDLRNPIAIIEGYTEYLQMNLPEGKLSAERMEKIANNLNMAAKRLEHYTESIRTLNQLEDMEIKRDGISSEELIEDIRDDFGMMASNWKISLEITNNLPKCQLQIDSAILFRILENVFGNALRFAKNTISITFAKNEKRMEITVEDDGDGFSEEVLKKNGKIFLPTQQEDGHMGMGLSVSRVLCEKHGGSLKFYNNEQHHGVVQILLKS